jgi:hypothetical protein
MRVRRGTKISDAFDGVTATVTPSSFCGMKRLMIA